MCAADSAALCLHRTLWIHLCSFTLCLGGHVLCLLPSHTKTPLSPSKCSQGSSQGWVVLDVGSHWCVLSVHGVTVGLRVFSDLLDRAQGAQSSSGTAGAAEILCKGPTLPSCPLHCSYHTWGSAGMGTASLLLFRKENCPVEPLQVPATAVLGSPGWGVPQQPHTGQRFTPVPGEMPHPTLRG